MPPYLHPRSHVTTSLFGATLLVSFLVVGMPHIIPCPAPRIVMADTDSTGEHNGDRRKRRRRKRMESNGLVDEEDDVEGASISLVKEGERLKKQGHECPVPKPGGIVGELLGFGKKDDKIRRPRPEVVVERQEEKRSRERREE